MSIRHFIVATAGHVDHGKSALVKALTGTDPDRLPEEKARGITIDLGFAHLELRTGAPVSKPARFGGQSGAGSESGAPVQGEGILSLGIVDVPGHEDFVKNMVAGIRAIDLALFVVAADDGWMPQTEEHLQILLYLGVPRAVVALTKIDLAVGREAGAVAAVRAKLEGTPFADAPIVPTSIVTGEGFDLLKTALANALAAAPPPRDCGKPRLDVDRAFTLKGIGTVVTGTLSGGSLERGQAIVLQPSGRPARVRGLQSHNRDVDRAAPGSRTALNLPDVPVADESADGVHRGDVVTLGGLGAPSQTADVLLEKSARLAHAEDGAGRPLKDGAIVRVHHGAANTPARVTLLTRKELAPGQSALARLRFERPVYLFAGDRFIVRDWPERHTIGGGLALDPDAAAAKSRRAAPLKFLEAAAQAPLDATAMLAALLERDHATRRDRAWLKSRFSAAELSEAAARLIARNAAMPAGEWLVHGVWWRELLAEAAQLVKQAHDTHPERPGLALNELRAALLPRLPDPALFDALVAAMTASGFVQAGSDIRAAVHRQALPPPLQAAGAKLRAALAAKPFEPPSRKELTPDAAAQKALRFLLDTGEAVEIGPDLVLLAEQFTRAREAIVKHLRERGPASASDLRQTLGTNRRVIIPLLERLDRDRVTERQGDLRRLRAAPQS
jgi:selenocysteine-specific elongation factor